SRILHANEVDVFQVIVAVQCYRLRVEEVPNGLWSDCHGKVRNMDGPASISFNHHVYVSKRIDFECHTTDRIPLVIQHRPRDCCGFHRGWSTNKYDVVSRATDSYRWGSKVVTLLHGSN